MAAPGEILRYELVNVNAVNQEDDFENSHLVRDLLQQNNIRGSVRIFLIGVERIFGNQLLQSQDYTVPAVGGISSWWSNNSFYIDWLVSSLETIFEEQEPDFEKLIITIVPQTFIRPINYIQSFQEGITNCVLTPILNYFEGKKLGSESKCKKATFNKKIKQTNQLMEKFIDGVPKGGVKEIVETLNVNISITDATRNTIIEEKTKGKQYNTFKFINTRINHVEEYTNVSYDKKTEISKDEYKKTMKELDETNEFYTFTKNEIHTKEKWYRISDPDDEAVQEWEDEQKLDKIEYFADPEMSEFVRKACHYGSCVDYKEDPFRHPELLKHIDHKTSYFRYEETAMYKKYEFPTAPKVYSYIPEDFKWWKYPGFYLIENISWTKVRTHIKQHLNKLNIYKTKDVYCVPELVFMKQLGITFKVVMGAFAYTKRELEAQGILDCGSVYKKWAGKQAMVILDKKITFKADKKLAQQLTFDYGKDRVRYYEPLLECSIYTRKQKLFHRSHISAYILAYSRIQILDQLFKIPVDKVRRVQLDGIYYEDCEIEQVLSFQNKPVEPKKNVGCDTYISSYDGEEWTPGSWRESHLHRVCIFGGEGGSGKTHSALTDRGLYDPVFTTPTHKLKEDKIKEYNLTNACCWNPILGEGTKEYPGQTHVIIVDEITQMSCEREQNLLERHPDSKIILCGDVERDEDGETITFQLPNFKGSPFDVSTIPIFNFERTEHSRCKDEELYKIQQILRMMIRLKYKTEDINQWLKETLSDREGDLDNYTVNDWIITGTHEKILELTKKIDEKRHFDKPIQNKWLITKMTSEYNNGIIVIQDEKPNNNSEFRHAFTAHQTQGITVKTKLFLDIDSFFDPRMAYTALSRAEYLDNVFSLL